MKISATLIRPLLVNATVAAAFVIPNVQAQTSSAAKSEMSASASSSASAMSERMSRDQRASKIIGTNVHDKQNQKLGEIKELVVDRDSGKVVYAVISMGGVMGVGDTLHAVPWRSLKRTEGEDFYRIDLDKTALQNSPKVDNNGWATLTSDPKRGEIYAYYKQQPYWDSEEVSDKMTEVKNNATNYMDDSVITAKVKTALLADEVVKGMDIHVETSKQTVQLSGFADSREQRTRAVQVASKVEGVKRIDNKLSIKP